MGKKIIIAVVILLVGLLVFKRSWAVDKVNKILGKDEKANDNDFHVIFHATNTPSVTNRTPSIHKPQTREMSVCDSSQPSMRYSIAVSQIENDSTLWT